MNEFDDRVNAIGRRRAMAFFLPRIAIILLFAAGIAAAAYFGVTP